MNSDSPMDLSVDLDVVLADLRLGPSGLIPVITQEWDSRTVLTLAWMDTEALRRTCATGLATYWSRSRGEYWVKGATSGNWQIVREIRVDCDSDALLMLVDQVGPACHTGTHSCFDSAPLATSGAAS